MNRGGAETQSSLKTGSPGRRLDFFLTLAVAAIAFALYLPSLSSDFTYDARLTILGNDYAHDLRHLWDVVTLRVIHQDVMDNNRPVHLGLIMLNWAAWGANPAGHHLFSNVLHALAAALLYRVCRALAGAAASPWASFAAALVFAVHPLCVEAVAQVSFRYDVIVTVCLLGALCLAVKFEPVKNRRNILLGAGIVLLMFLAIAAKENGIAGPFLLIAYWQLYRRRESRTGWGVLCAAACFAVGAFLLARFTLRPAVSVIFTQDPVRPGGTLAEWANIQPQIWAFYLRQIAWPRGLCAEYGWFSVQNYPVGFAALAVIAVVGAQATVSFYSRTFALGAILFWCALLPVSNLIPIYKPMADRFMYLPMAGVALMLAGLPWQRLPSGRQVAFALAMVASCCLAWSTIRRQKTWHDSLSLWSEAATRNPHSPDARNSLGWALYTNGKYEEALVQYRIAMLMTHGKSADDLAGMAVIYDAMGRTAEADDAFKKAAALDSRYAHTELLLRAMVWEKADAARLQVIADRNAK